MKMTKSFNMIVSEKEKDASGVGKYVPRGSVEVFYPTLEDMGLTSPVKEYSEEGFPVYADDKAQFVFDGLLAAVKANARNKLEVVNGTVKLKEGLTIPDTTEALLESGGGNTGAALAAIREFNAAFKAFMAKSGKSVAIQAAVCNFMANPATISIVQDTEKKEKIRNYLLSFAETITSEQATAWAKRMELINSNCDSISALEDANF